jgi:hypothetical protein
MAQLNAEVTSIQAPDSSLAARFYRRKSSLVGSSDARSVVEFAALVSISAWKGQLWADQRHRSCGSQQRQLKLQHALLRRV